MQKDKMPETIWRECEERIAMDQRQYLTGLMSRCYDARDSHPSEKKLQQLFDEASPFCGIPIAGKYVTQAIAEKNLSKLAGALGMCLSADGEDRVSVTQNATATASVDISQSVSVVQSLPESSLSDEDKTTLIGLLATLQNSEGEQKKSKLMEVLRFLCDKAADAAIAVIPIIAGMV